MGQPPMGLDLSCGWNPSLDLLGGAVEAFCRIPEERGEMVLCLMRLEKEFIAVLASPAAKQLADTRCGLFPA